VSTRGDYGFIENGKTYYCYAHYDNRPDIAIPALINFLSKYGYIEYVRQLKTMGIRGGIRMVGDGVEGEFGEWFDDHKPEGEWDTELYNESENDFGYLVHEDFTIEVMRYEKPVGAFDNHAFIMTIFEENIRDVIARFM
jgi:hypothetical protein